MQLAIVASQGEANDLGGSDTLMDLNEMVVLHYIYFFTTTFSTLPKTRVHIAALLTPFHFNLTTLIMTMLFCLKFFKKTKIHGT